VAGGLPGARPQRAAQWRDQVQSGLVNLGWAARDADQAIAALEEDGTIAAANGADPQTVDVAAVLRAALRRLSRQ
jgi:Holliday junction DNA helicase RuvA